MLINKKCFLTFMILIVLLFGLTIVSAADSNDTDIQTNPVLSTATITKTIDNTNILDENDETNTEEYNKVVDTSKPITKQNTTNKISKTSTSVRISYPHQIRSEINNAKNSNDDSYTIYLNPGKYYLLNNLTWGNATGSTRKLILEGLGSAVIDGSNLTQFITVKEGYILELKNIELTNFVADTGNVLINEGTSIINNCKIINNSGRKFGSLVNYRNLTVVNSSFIGNNLNGDSSSGAAISNAVGGTTNIIDSNFSNNTVNYMGGAIYNPDNGIINITHSNFTYNYANTGGVLNNFGTLIISYSNFTKNNANQCGVIHSRLGNITILNSFFGYNKAYSYGTLYLYPTVKLTLINTTFDTNSPKNFIIRNNKINFIVDDDFISLNNVSVYADNNDSPIYTGLLNKFRVPESVNKIYLVVDGRDTNTFCNNVFVLEVYTDKKIVNNYEELVEAVEYAKTTDNDFLIYVNYGDTFSPNEYHATSNITLGKGLGYMRKLTLSSLGSTTTLYGDDTYHFISVSAGYTLELQYLNINGYVGKDDGVIFNEGTISIENVNFNNNTAENGGAIFNKGTISIENAIFNNNTAENGGAIFNEGTISLNNVNFNNNIADNCGGVIYNFRDVINLNNCNFINNSAKWGGVIYSNGTSTYIKYLTSEGNTLQFTHYNTKIILTDSNITSNNATFGGAIYSTGSIIEIRRSTLANNTAVKGGVIYNNGETEIIYLAPESHLKPTNVENDAIINVIDSEIINNNAEEDGGVIYNTEGVINIINSNIIDNSAKNGGFTYNIGRVFQVLSNKILFMEYWIYYSNAYVNLNDSEFINNSAENGGVIYNTEEGMVNIKDSKFDINSASQIGGVVYSDGRHTDVVDENGDPALMPHNPLINITYSHFTANNAYEGGVIYCLHSSLDVTGSYFNNNQANNGSALYSRRFIPLMIEESSPQPPRYINVTDSFFTENYAEDSGSIYYNGVNVAVTGSYFNSNHALCGAGIYHRDNDASTSNKLEVTDCHFTNNTAINNGGAIYAFAYIAHSEFTANTAGIAGGAQYYDANITNCTYKDNIATMGGALYYGNYNLTESKFINNSAENSGVIYGSYINVINSTFINNHANSSGVISPRDAVYINGSSFLNNHAKIVDKNYATVLVTDSTFIENVPENFVKQDDKIVLKNDEGYINANIVSVYLDDNDTCAYTGKLINYRIPKGYHKLHLIVNGTDTIAYGNNKFIIPIYYDSYVRNYTQLVEAVEHAKTLDYDYTICLYPGDYNATTTMYWEGPIINRKLTIEGNGILMDGQGIYQFMVIHEYYTLIINNVTFYNFGGDSTIHNNGNLIINASNFVNNTCDNFGAVISNILGAVNVTDSKFENNYAIDAGAIYNREGPLNLNNCIFTNNHADESGGVIYNIYECEINIIDCKLLNNYVQNGDGGVILNRGGLINIVTSEFKNNSAYNGRGGIIYQYTQSSNNGVIIIDSNFTHNTADYGGVICIDTGIANITGSNFISNTAIIEGGVIYRNTTFNPSVNAIDNTFMENSPVNFVVVDNIWYLDADENYIPENATVNILVKDNIQTCEMVDKKVLDYALPLGTYRTYLILNSSSTNNFRNNTFVFDINENTIDFILDEKSSEYRNFNIPISVNSNVKCATVNITSNGNCLGTKYIDSCTDNFVVNVDMKDYPTGIYTINIQYSDDVTGNLIEKTEVLNLLPAIGVVNVNVLNSTKDNVTLKIVVNDITGTLESSFYDGEINVVDAEGYTVGHGRLNNGSTTITLKRLDYTLDNTELTVYYGGDTMLGICNASTQSIIYTLRDSELTIISTNNIYKNTMIIVRVFDLITGKNVTSGKVEVTSNDEIVGNAFINSDGTGIVPLNLDNKNYLLTATYKGNDYYNPSSAATDISVTATTDIRTDVLSNIVNKTKINITVYNNITNTPIDDALIEIRVDGGSVINHDTSTPFNPVLPVGEHTITIMYPETRTIKNYQNSTKILVLTISEDLEEIIAELTAAKATTLTFDPIVDAKYNSNVTISGMLINEDSIGLFNQNVTLTINGKKIKVITKGGLFEYTTLFKSVGEQTVTAKYAGTEKYLSSNATVSFTIDKQDTVITIDDITDVKYLDKINITGTFKNANGQALINSNVKVTVNGQTRSVKTDDHGIFTFEYRADTVGENILNVNYAGNARYNSCETLTTFTVDKKNTIIIINEVENVKYNDMVTVTGSFKNADGIALRNSKILLYINGERHTVTTDSNGLFTYEFQANTMGENNITVSYSGNAKYNAYETETITFTVDKKDTLITVDTINDVKKGEQVTVKGILTNADGTILKNSNVIVYVNGGHHTVKTDANGNYNYTFTAKKVGQNEIIVKYNGNTKYNTYETSTTFKVFE